MPNSVAPHLELIDGAEVTIGSPLQLAVAGAALTAVVIVGFAK